MVAEIQILTYVPLPLLTFVLVAIWLAGLTNIWNRRNDGSFEVVHLVVMGVLISLLTAGALFVVGAALPAEWGWRSLTSDAAGERCDSPAESYVFSFGIERAWCDDIED